MSEFEDKLNKILSSPEDMEKIAGLARSLSGPRESDGEQKSGEERLDSPDLSSLASSLGKIDPKLLGLLGRLFSDHSDDRNDKAALLEAIKPFLKEDRREQISKAAEIAKMAKLAKIAFSEFSGGGSGV